MTSIDCVRSAPPRNNAFQLACNNAADNTSTIENGVSKAGSFWRRLDHQLNRFIQAPIGRRGNGIAGFPAEAAKRRYRMML